VGHKRISELSNLIMGEKDSKKLIPLSEELRKLLAGEQARLESALGKNPD
jgi:hypothetical protein